MKIKAVLFSLVVFVSIFLGECFAQASMVQRIVSLGPFLTEEIILLGAADRLVGVTTYCQVDNLDIEKIATIIDVNIEKAIELQTDLVLATALTSVDDVKRLRDLGIKVMVFPQAKNFDQMCAQFYLLAGILDKMSKAKEIVSEARRQIVFIEKSHKDLPTQKVFIQVGSRPLFSVGKDSFINDLVVKAGGANIAENSNEGLFSREEVLRANPDIIIISGMGINFDTEKNIWLRYKTIDAVANDRIFEFDAYRLCSPTPVSFVEALKELVGLFYPQL
ncbi:MAG: helical backbone metal receptor [Candidatus Gygaella obscura]|nr:helical backbone metal receptor [Candidatus Gygaella obscura]